MNMKLQILQCVLTAILSTAPVMPSTLMMPTIKNPEYLPIIGYQESLSERISKYINSFLYEKNKTEPTVIITEKYVPELSREQALEEMKSITTKIFDIHDTNDLSTHLLTMKELSQNLHPEDDIKTINAIHFLLENQHRSSMLDKLFWWNANKQHEFDTTIPVTEETKAKNDKLIVIFTKMGLESKRKKEEAKEKEQAEKMKASF